MAAGDCPQGCSSYSTYYFLLILHFSVWHLFPREIFLDPVCVKFCYVIIELSVLRVSFWVHKSFFSTWLQAKHEPGCLFYLQSLEYCLPHYRHLILVQCVDEWTWKAQSFILKNYSHNNFFFVSIFVFFIMQILLACWKFKIQFFRMKD